MREWEARVLARVMRWCATPDEPGQLSPMAPWDAALALALPVVILALLAPLAT